MAKKKKKRPQIEAVPTNCDYCKGSPLPDYKSYDELRRFQSNRSKILGRNRTGICAKHQRKVTQAIKRARHLGLLPFVPRV